MLAKLITLPIASAIARASWHPPDFRIESRAIMSRNTAKNATTVSFPNASSQATRTVVIAASWS
jgi:L-cysteine desulfidase